MAVDAMCPPAGSVSYNNFTPILFNSKKVRKQSSRCDDVIGFQPNQRYLGLMRSTAAPL